MTIPTSFNTTDQCSRLITDSWDFVASNLVHWRDNLPAIRTCSGLSRTLRPIQLNTILRSMSSSSWWRSSLLNILTQRKRNSIKSACSVDKRSLLISVDSTLACRGTLWCQHWEFLLRTRKIVCSSWATAAWRCASKLFSRCIQCITKRQRAMWPKIFKISYEKSFDWCKLCGRAVANRRRNIHRLVTSKDCRKSYVDSQHC